MLKSDLHPHFDHFEMHIDRKAQSLGETSRIVKAEFLKEAQSPFVCCNLLMKEGETIILNEETQLHILLRVLPQLKSSLHFRST